MTPGVYPSMPFEQYHALDAIRSSDLRHVDISELAYLAHVEDDIDRESEALRLGSAAHCRLLTPDLFARRFCCEPDLAEFGRTKAGAPAASPRATAAYKGERERLQTADLSDDEIEAGVRRSVLTLDSWHECYAMTDALMAHPGIAELVEAGDSETTILWEEQGHLCKARFDLLLSERGIGADVKTTRDIVTFSPQAIERYGIYRQAAWYMRGAKALGIDVREWLLPVVANYQPYETALFRLEEPALQLGRDENEKSLRRIIRAKDSGEYPSRFGLDIVPATVSDWTFNRFYDEEALRG